jgi:DNA polymerase-3 subunit gamma/tau
VPPSSDSISLYRRHRPGSFDEVVGQQHVVRTLSNAVEQDKVHHAYLFVGSRGTGKTSMAKILARSLNCERGGPTVTPCGECESCTTIASGSSIDVIEMDAASNRSVDDVRDLRERVAYAPTGGRWKVYILDEAHMLTKEAWNAFLKTLEEPPPNTVFVLATTEAHKVMPTIADRCQRFDFQRPSLEQISEVITRVAGKEEIEIEEGAVAMIARSASGSFRDALGTLDQLVAFGGPKVDLSGVLELLGAADAELLFDTVASVAAEDPRGVLLGIEKMARSGRDPVQFARDLLAHLRHLLVTQTIGEVPNTFVVTATDASRLTAQAAEIGPAALVRTIDELADALTAVREGDDARMAIEIALLKAARPDIDPSTAGLARRIERLERKLGVVPEAAEEAPQAPAPSASSDSAAESPPAKDAPAKAAPSKAAPSKAAPANATSPKAAPEKATAPKAATSGGAPSADAAPDEDAAPKDAPAKSGSAKGPAAQKPTPPSAAPPSKKEAAKEPAPKQGGPASKEAASTEAAPAKDAGESSFDLEKITRIWPAVLDHLRQSAPALAATFEGARPVAFDAKEGVIQIGFPATSTFNKRKAEAPDKRELVAKALDTVTGEILRPMYVLLDGEGEAESPAAVEEIDEDALVERLKNEFNAEEVS